MLMATTLNKKVARFPQSSILDPLDTALGTVMCKYCVSFLYYVDYIYNYILLHDAEKKLFMLSTENGQVYVLELIWAS